MLYIIVCSTNILCIWNWALNWASFLVDRFVDSVISQSTACLHGEHNIIVNIFLLCTGSHSGYILPVLILQCLTNWPSCPCYVCRAFSLVVALLPPPSIRTISVRQHTTGRCVPVHLQIKHNWKKSSFMIRVHFCVSIEPSPGRAVQQMRHNNQKTPNQPKSK